MFKSKNNTNMARNKSEQIAYLLKRRNSGMSDKDFLKELETLYNIGFDDGRSYYLPTDFERID